MPIFHGLTESTLQIFPHRSVNALAPGESLGGQSKGRWQRHPAPLRSPGRPCYRMQEWRNKAVNLLKTRGSEVTGLSRPGLAVARVPPASLPANARQDGRCYIGIKMKQQSRQFIESKGPGIWSASPAGGQRPGWQCHAKQKMQEQSRQLVESKR